MNFKKFTFVLSVAFLGLALSCSDVLASANETKENAAQEAQEPKETKDTKETTASEDKKEETSAETKPSWFETKCEKTKFLFDSKAKNSLGQLVVF